MSSPGTPDNYNIEVAFAGLMPEPEYKYHECHYKTGQLTFDSWLRLVSDRIQWRSINLNSFESLAWDYIEAGNEISTTALYDLQRWLRGRQFCYAHHLLKGNADDGHFHPIVVARRLVRVFAPEEAENILARCTPINLLQLVDRFGTDTAKAEYTSSQSGQQILRRPSVESEREQKLRDMTKIRSWRQPSSSPYSDAASALSSSSLCSWSSGSTSNTASSSASWRSRSSSDSSGTSSPSTSKSTWSSVSSSSSKRIDHIRAQMKWR